jgi:hypothetical protein
MHVFSDDPFSQKLLRVNVVARRLCRSERTIRRLIQIGKLPAQRINGRAWGVRVVDIVGLQAQEAQWLSSRF